MNTELLGFILDAMGKVMIAYAAIQVHRHVRKKRKVDEFIFKAMKREQIIGIMGITLIIVGSLLQIPSKL